MKKFIGRMALVGVVALASGCTLGVNQPLLDEYQGHPAGLENASDHANNNPGGGLPGNGGGQGGANNGGGQDSANNGGGQGGGNGGGDSPSATGNPGGVGSNGHGGNHANSGGGNGSEGDPDMDPGRGNDMRSDKSKGKNQDQD